MIVILEVLTLIGILVIIGCLIYALKIWKNKVDDLEARKIRFYFDTGEKNAFGFSVGKLIDSEKEAGKFGIIALGIFVASRKIRMLRIGYDFIAICYDVGDQYSINFAVDAGQFTGEQGIYSFAKLTHTSINIDDLIKYADEKKVLIDFLKNAAAKTFEEGGFHELTWN